MNFASDDPFKLIIHCINNVAFQSKSDSLRFKQNIVETQRAKFHKEAQDNMDDYKSDPSTSQSEVSITNQLFHSFEQLAELKQKNTYW